MPKVSLWVAILTAVASASAYMFLRPSAADLSSLVLFLLASASATVTVVAVALRLGLGSRFRSLSVLLLAGSLTTVLLALANVAFMAHLMFISAHDLALLTLLLAFSAGIAAVVSAQLSAPLSADLEKMIVGVRQVASGDFAARVRLARRDELAELAQVFNGMSEQLETAFRHEREMEASRRELVAAISHDLRTPLASIRAMVEGILDGVVADPASVRRYLQTMEGEVAKLTQLINDLFELSQIDAKALELHRELVPVEQLVADTVNSMLPQAAQRGLALVATLDAALPSVSADPLRIQQVLANLVQNALRHTPIAGSVCIGASELGDEVRVDVSDTGEGLPPDDLSRVFERFYRADHSRSRVSGGAGLGLAIAKGIVEAHGGRIWARNNPDRGATFSFTLPRGTAAML